MTLHPVVSSIPAYSVKAVDDKCAVRHGLDDQPKELANFRS